MADSYPVREQFFSHRFCRILTKAAAAQEIGSDACWMLTVVAHQEDAKRYRGAVTYYNGQLMPLCGFNRDRQLIKARNRAIEAGWLHYEPGGKSKPGIYWVTVPPEFQDMPDTPMDEGTPICHAKFGSESGNQNQNREIPLPNKAIEVAIKAQSKWQPFYPSPNPIPKEETSAIADVCTEPVEATAPHTPAEELTEFIFECVGKGAKSWTLPKSKMDEYLEAYPDLDVRAEIRKARQWIRDNPTRRKTAGTGMLRFITSWLNRAQNKNQGTSHAERPSVEKRNQTEFEQAIAAARERERNSGNPPDFGGYLP